MKYTQLLLAILCTFMVQSCTSPAYPSLVANCKDADKVYVHFFEKGTKKAIKSKVATEKVGIDAVRNYIEGGKSTERNCVPDGIIVFYKAGAEVLKTYISYSEANCWQLSTKVNNDWVYIDMSAEGKTFFEALDREADKNDIILNF